MENVVAGSSANVVAGLSTIDYVIFGIYAIVIVAIGLYSSRKNTKSAEGYFLAGKSIPWWAVGASLIAANISAEQFIGMSGSGYAIGFGIAAYEFMAAVTLILVGKYFLPIFIEKGIYTIPEFVEKRFNKTLKTILAVFWICLYIFVNLSSVLYLGGLALETILGIPMMYTILGLAAFALIYSVYTNGSSRVIGKIALATFANDRGLEKAGDNTFVESNNSGMAKIGESGIAGKGISMLGRFAHQPHVLAPR